MSMAESPANSLLSVACAFAILVALSASAEARKQEAEFIYNGFKGANLSLDGSANIHHNGLLELTNQTNEQKGHALYPSPLSLTSSPLFSTTFVFAINPLIPTKAKGHGLAFLISSSKNMTRTSAALFLGLVNRAMNGNSASHLFAIELDTTHNAHVGDIDGNHVGIDINSITSVSSASASYYSDRKQKEVTLDLASGKPMQVWIDYDGNNKLVTVALAPLGEPKPSRFLLSKRGIDLKKVLLDTIYVGFSASTGSVSSNHYILGWSFNQSGKAKEFDLSKLPQVPKKSAGVSLVVVVVVLLVIVAALLMVIIGIAYVISSKKYGEVMEEWEEEFALQRFSCKELYKATKGFNESEVLGAGGFGKVYKGTLKSTKTEVAVKRISHDSRQGMKEFVSEVATMKRLRHRNLVQLLGYCRRKGELLLVYEYMPNGSLDKFLFNKEAPALSWPQRFRIIRGVASALLYLHEEWEQVVLHRDVKASNILLDANMEARLGDFGLARLHDHGSNPQTTHVVGTVGYLAPEFSRTGKATTGSDVFAYGTFVLEVACGRRPIDVEGLPEDVILVDWVWKCWKRGEMMEARDRRLEEGGYDEVEMELALKVGMLCAQPRPESRPSMRQAMQFLNGDVKLPEMPPSFEEIGMFAKSTGTSTSLFSDGNSACISYSTTDSVLRDGR